MKRFYKTVTYHCNQNGLYEIHLDGKPVKTSQKNDLLVPNDKLASLLMQEWAAQGEEIKATEMPFTQICSTCADTKAELRGDVARQALGYIDTDLICYRTDEPKDIAEKQRVCWDVFTDLYKKRYGLDINTTLSLISIKQNNDVHAFFAQEIEALDDLRFTVLQIVTAFTGSVMLALLFVKGDVSAGQIFEAAFVEEFHKDELYKAAQYGRDPHIEKKQISTRRDLSAAEKILQACD